MRISLRTTVVYAYGVAAAGLWLALPAARAAEAPTEVTVDAQKVIGRNDRFWSNAVFHPTEYLDSDWGKEHVTLLHCGGVTLNYVRIYNQPEDAAYRKADGTLGYRWDHFDRRADMLLAQGSRLLVAFYSMPPQIAADADTFRKRSFLEGKKIYIGPPREYRLWQEMCADFTRHVIQRYGEQRAAQWRFTCWNEPDLSGFWHKGDVVEYRKLYDHFAAGVKSVSSRIPIGGPAFSSNHIYKQPELFREFLAHVAAGQNYATGRQGTPIDYIAMHTYGGHGGKGSTRCPYPSVDYLLEQQRRLVDMRNEFPSLRAVPIVVQEWGMSSSGTTGMDQQPMAEVRNTHYAAAFLATLVAQHTQWRLTENPGISDLFVCLSGYEKQRQRDFEGKRTVQTRSGFDKPFLNGYRLLAKLRSEWVSSRVEPAGKNLWALAARDGQRQVAVVVTHFCNDRPAGDGPAQSVVLDLATPWSDEARIELRHWRIDATHSNAYTVYCQLGRPVELTAAQLAQIKQRMGLEPLEEPRAVRLREGRLRLTLDLPCNAVSLVELIKQP